MNKKQLEARLKGVGLSDKEAKVYLAGLELGPTTAAEIARNAGIKRPTAYLIIESLERMGLMSISFKGMKRLFTAEAPAVLTNLLDQKRQALDTCIDELNVLYGAAESRSLIKYYRGEKAIRGAYEAVLDRLRSTDEYLVFGDLQSWYDSDPEYFKDWPMRRQKIIRHGRSIYQDSPMAREYLKYEKNFQTNVKILPKKATFSAIKLISSHFVFIHKAQKPGLVLVIENQSLVDLYKEMFEVMWEMLPKN